MFLVEVLAFWGIGIVVVALILRRISKYNADRWG